MLMPICLSAPGAGPLAGPLHARPPEHHGKAVTAPEPRKGGDSPGVELGANDQEEPTPPQPQLRHTQLTQVPLKGLKEF